LADGADRRSQPGIDAVETRGKRSSPPATPAGKRPPLGHFPGTM
jgi:hypothetical protein